MTIGRTLGALIVPSSGTRHLEVGQHFEQEGLEGLVGAVELVDQQDRRALGMRARAPASSGRRIRIALVEDVGRELAAIDARPAASASRISIICAASSSIHRPRN